MYKRYLSVRCLALGASTLAAVAPMQRAEAAVQGCVPQSPGSSTYLHIAGRPGDNHPGHYCRREFTTPGDHHDPGFSIKTASGDAITISGTGSFTDDATSSIIGAANGIGFANSTGTGAISVTANGIITGQNGYGIYTWQSIWKIAQCAKDLGSLRKCVLHD